MRLSGSTSGMWKRSMAWIVRHRQTKEPGTDRPSLNHRATSRLYPCRPKGVLSWREIANALTERKLPSVCRLFPLASAQWDCPDASKPSLQAGYLLGSICQACDRSVPPERAPPS
jgi:hypothetical protein